MTARRRSTEYGGVGQSGYTTGRSLPDRALELEIQVRNTTLPHGISEAQLTSELETDDRWTGRGGSIPSDGDDDDPDEPLDVFSSTPR